MALYRDKLTDVPTGIFYHKRNNIKYVYVYTKFYRNKNGKARNNSKCIGKIDNDSGKLIPNDYYFVHYNISNPIESNIFNIGYTLIVEQCFNKTNLGNILCDNFGQDLAIKIKVIATYISLGNVSMSYVDDFMKKNYCKGIDELITSQVASVTFESIIEKGLDNFFKEWIKKAAGRNYLCYDVTSVSTYSSNITEAEYGYNRDHEDLEQVNIGLFSVENTKIPVYYEDYNGSLTDKGNIINVIKNAKDKGLKKVKLVMDGGSFDKERIIELKNSNLIFTIGMPMKLKSSKELINKYGSNIYEYQNSTNYLNTFGKLVEYEIYGVKGNVFIGMDTQARNLELENIRTKIARIKNDLIHTRKKYDTIVKDKKITKYFDIKPKEKSNGFTFELNDEKVNNETKYSGYFLIFTTDLEATSKDIIYYYREKDVDEKIFYAMKNYIDLGRLRTHKQTTTDGKIFVSFIALIIRSWVMQKVYDYKEMNNLTYRKIANILNDIIVILTNGDVRLLKSLTKQQKDILALFGLNTENINDFINREFR